MKLFLVISGIAWGIVLAFLWFWRHTLRPFPWEGRS